MSRVRIETHRLRPPALPQHLVDRPRLTRAILSVEPGGICLVTAPVGYGATTAIAAALRASPDRVMWVDVGDLGGAAAVALFSRAILGETRSGDISEIIDALAETAPTWLVVTGLGGGGDERFADTMAELARYLPHPCRLAICTHARIPALEALASTQPVLRLTQRELAFDTDEAVELLSGSKLDVDASTGVLSRAEGWASALRLASNTTGDGDEFGSRSLGTLFDGWFASLPPGDQRLLLETAIVDLISPGLATAICGSEAAGRRLVALDNRYSFIEEVPAPPGHSGTWWRRHGLLTRFLRQRSEPDSLERHSRAADWFASVGDVDQTVRHLVVAGRTREAGAYITQHETALFTAGQAQKILKWYDQLPEALGPRTAHLLRMGWGQILSGDVRGCSLSLARLQAELPAVGAADPAELRMAEHPSQVETITGEVELLRANLGSYQADPRTMIDAGSAAMAEFEGRSRTESSQLAPLVVARGLLWSGQSIRAARLIDRASQLPFPQDLLRESNLAGLTAQVTALNGNVNRARALVSSALEWTESEHIDPLAVLQFGLVSALGLTQLEGGHLSEGAATLAAARSAAEQNHQLGEAVWAAVLLAHGEALRGDLGAALRTLAGARGQAEEATPGTAFAVVLDQEQALVHLAAGDSVRAERLIRALPPGEARSMLVARFQLTRQPVLARKMLESMTPAAVRLNAQRHLLLASAHRPTSRRLAQAHIRQAAGIARRNGLATLLTYPADQHLLDLAHETAREHSDDDLQWLYDASSAGPAHIAAQAPAGGPTLSRGELHLLSLLPTRAQNAEIADELAVTVNTVKTRLRRLYAKLGARSRDEAIAAAVQRGILPGHGANHA